MIADGRVGCKEATSHCFVKTQSSYDGGNDSLRLGKRRGRLTCRLLLYDKIVYFKLRYCLNPWSKLTSSKPAARANAAR